MCSRFNKIILFISDIEFTYKTCKAKLNGAKFPSVIQSFLHFLINEGEKSGNKCKKLFTFSEIFKVSSISSKYFHIFFLSSFSRFFSFFSLLNI